MTLLPPRTTTTSQLPDPEHINRFTTTLLSSDRIPFTGSDSSVGMEYELQVAVEGQSHQTDLPITIKNSSYFRNIEKRVARGDLKSSSATIIKDFLENNSSNIWENSWVRLDINLLSPGAKELLKTDFLADKQNPDGPSRQDLHRFYTSSDTHAQLRIPISYLLKLSFADILATTEDLPRELRETGRKLLDNFQSDNTSPEILSLTTPYATDHTVGKLAATESCRTFLIIQLLCQYANTRFGLINSGQRCIIYNAPHAPCRQKRLNEIVPDNFYRHLFLSPCLSGWDRGEEKQEYMALCHKTLSRSQLNTISKLRDAGIITNNLVILPNTSNTCLANNGTHVSLGSRLLSQMGAESDPLLFPKVEKYLGDLVIKIIEHFLPLFVTTYSSAPYRVDFADFHPEKMLGFLPHELDYTHLRMLWRRWKKKADIRCMGHALTPFGPRKLDSLLAMALGLRGDTIPDFRLIDYLVTLLSTDTSPGLDGTIGNHEHLTSVLAEAGIFDSRMSIYLPYRMRAYHRMGYSGFEGRIYSLFPSLLKDMEEAVNLQNLITALAYRYALTGVFTHNSIPDTPFIESERRQMFFAAAIGLPTVYIRKDTGNLFLQDLLRKIPSQRHSRRYKNYIRIKVKDYCRALIEIIRQDGADLCDRSAIQEITDNLLQRIEGETTSAASQLIRDSAGYSGQMKSPEKTAAGVFNQNLENYYRNELRKKHLQEGFTVLQNDCFRLDRQLSDNSRKLHNVLPAGSTTTISSFVSSCRRQVTEESTDPETIRRLIHICLAIIHQQNS